MRMPRAMLRRAALFLSVAACASTQSLDGPGTHDAGGAAPENRDGDDGGAVDTDGAACGDCAFFPEACVADALCVAGPFDSAPGGSGLDPRVTVHAMRARSPSDIWVAGAMGALAHFDGTSWRRSELGKPDTLRAVWLRESGEIAISVLPRTYSRGLAVGDGGAEPSTDGWVLNPPRLPPEYSAFAPALTFASAWNAPGSEWLWCALTAADDGASGLWRMRLADDGALEVQNGAPGSTCRVQPCGPMKSVHGSSADEIWAVGSTGAALRITGADGDSPVVQGFNTLTSNSLDGVYAAAPNDVWAVGAAGTVRHYTGDAILWDVVSELPTQKSLHAVAGSSATDIWAVGDEGVVLHYDGKTWSRIRVAGLGKRRPQLTTVLVDRPGHVWVGGQGVTLSLGGTP